MDTRRIPLSCWLIALPGMACLIAASALALGDTRTLPPLLAEPAAVLALGVSGLALLGSAAFPLVLRRLALAEADRTPD